MTSSSPTVGADIEAECGKCKTETWHVILAMVGDTIARVQCKGCGAQHRYKSALPAQGSGPGQASGAGARARGGTGARAKGSRAAARQVLPPEPRVPLDPSRPVRPYSMASLFEVTDRVGHPQFGEGVVELSEPGKVTVWFPSGRRVLAQAQGEAQLLRRRPTPAEVE